MDIREYITSSPDIMLGKPVIKGTRITVAHILNKLADGFNSEELLEMYPNLELNHIRAAITYAASVVSNEESIAAA